MHPELVPYFLNASREFGPSRLSIEPHKDEHWVHMVGHVEKLGMYANQHSLIRLVGTTSTSLKIHPSSSFPLADVTSTSGYHA